MTSAGTSFVYKESPDRKVTYNKATHPVTPSDQAHNNPQPPPSHAGSKARHPPTSSPPDSGNRL